VRIYVAGGSDERIEVARHAIDMLIKNGFTVTHDWTRCEGYDRIHTDDERRAWAGLDVEGVRSADVVWAMAPAEKSEGTATEIGIALALGKLLIVSGPRARGNIFATLAAQIHETHDRAFRAIVDLWGSP
jgi:nucleoside 2-deoxyribosyltransferase